MKTSISSINILTRCVLIFTISITAALAALAAPDATFVTYEDFGAVGDGITDDLPAICKAHQHANEKGLPIRSKPEATYHLGRKAITAIIATNTDWATSKFIIDDSKGVENHRKSLYEVRSLLEPISLKIDRLSKGQKQLDLRPTCDCVVYVENKNRKRYIRRGKNQNNGSPQQEVFILHKNGSITGSIEWDYDVVTSIKAQPIDPEQLVIRGGLFTNIANQYQEGQKYSYWARNINILRSNTLIDGVQHRVTGEKDQGYPYRGFLSVSQCANVTLQNCKISARKVYKKNRQCK